ncbi:MAG TPA: prepilin-type N-terminal cleavage/methylation domain-containing protein [Usitatibacter sp.]|nr:prepilin-type N-terminal cleavage/methylation domain-containing protein [Usitatibacter sp.]
MKSPQSGFTLVEIAIVLVIIGLLLGGILKGQELINSAKVKNLANDFRVIPTYIYAYQDKFRAIPGDDKVVATHVTGGTPGTGGTLGNGAIEGAWNSAETSDIESNVFWQHVRLANLAAGPTTIAAGFGPTNAVGGRLGVSSLLAGQAQVAGLTGTYQICSAGIQGKFAKQLDVAMDDGNVTAGSMRAVPDNSPLGTAAADITTDVQLSSPYTVCLAF